MQKRITITEDSIRCSTCLLNEICLPLGMPSEDLVKLDELVKERIRFVKGAPYFITKTK